MNFEDRMAMMEIRKNLVDEHMARMHHIYYMWGRAETPDEWKSVSSDIWRTIDFLTGRERYFPNFTGHVSQWSCLFSIATERMRMAYGPEDELERMQIN